MGKIANKTHRHAGSSWSILVWSFLAMNLLATHFSSCLLVTCLHGFKQEELTVNFSSTDGHRIALRVTMFQNLSVAVQEAAEHTLREERKRAR